MVRDYCLQSVASRLLTIAVVMHAVKHDKLGQLYCIPKAQGLTQSSGCRKLTAFILHLFEQFSSSVSPLKFHSVHRAPF